MLISRGCPWASMKRGGCKLGGCKTGAVNGQKGGGGGGCSFAVGTQAQRVSAPPPPPGVGGCRGERGGGGGSDLKVLAWTDRQRGEKPLHGRTSLGVKPLGSRAGRAWGALFIDRRPASGDPTSGGGGGGTST